MHLLWLNVAPFAVAFVYCIYQTHSRLAERKRRALRQRVAYLLWMVAARADREETLTPT